MTPNYRPHLSLNSPTEDKLEPGSCCESHLSFVKEKVVTSVQGLLFNWYAELAWSRWHPCTKLFRYAMLTGWSQKTRLFLCVYQVCGVLFWFFLFRLWGLHGADSQNPALKRLPPHFHVCADRALCLHSSYTGLMSTLGWWVTKE